MSADGEHGEPGRSSTSPPDPAPSPSCFRVELRSAMNGDLLAEVQHTAPVSVGVLQCSLAAMLHDDVRPALLFQGSPLKVEEVIPAATVLEVIRRPLTQEVAERLQRARADLQRLRLPDLHEMRGCKVPPEPNKHLLSAILLLRNVRDHSWLSMSKLLAKRGLLQDLVALEPLGWPSGPRDIFIFLILGLGLGFRV